MPELEGKASKQERTQINKQIYNLENDDAYVAALKEGVSKLRAEAAAADDAAHAAKLQREMEEAATRDVEMERRAAMKAMQTPAQCATQSEVDGEVHMEIKMPKLRKAPDESIKVHH